MYRALAEAVLMVHLAFIVWVMFGAVVTRGRPWLAALHIASAVYGIVAELGPWPCPLTLAETYFEARGGLTPYQGPFLLHYSDATVTPICLLLCSSPSAWRFAWPILRFTVGA